MKILLTDAELREGVARLAAEISHFYCHRPLTLIGVMTGSVVFMADLMRRIDLPMRVGVIHARSYRGGTRPGELVIHDELIPEVRGRDVLLIDDMFDTGRTLSALVDRLKALGARSVRSCVLLAKPARTEVAYRPDYVGFEVPDRFVVGYGMDYLDAYRNLPHVAVLEDGEPRVEAAP